MNFSNPIVKATAALVLAILLLVGVGAGSVAYDRRNQAMREQIVTAQLQTKVAEATKAADFHESRANDIASQRDSMVPVLKAAEKKARDSKAALQEALSKPEPPDLSGELVLRTEQRDAAVVALHDEETAHATTRQDRDLALAEGKELRLEVNEVRGALLSQIQLTAQVTTKLENSEKWRLRYKNLSIGFGLVLGGAAAQNYIAHR